MFSHLFKRQSTQELFDLGFNAYQNGDPKTAVNKLSDAIKMEKGKLNPDKNLLSNIYNIRGEVYLSVGVAVLSQSDFANSLNCDPTNESALNNLGVWFSIETFATPDYERSLNYFDMAVKIRPDRQDIILNRAIVKIKSGDQTGCQDLEDLAKENYPDAIVGLQRFCVER